MSDDIGKLFDDLDEVTRKLIGKMKEQYTKSGQDSIFSYERFVSVDPDGERHVAEFVNGKLQRNSETRRHPDVEYIANSSKGELRVLVYGPLEPDGDFEVKTIGRGRIVVSTKGGYQKEVNFPPTYFEMKKRITNGLVEIILS